MGFMGIKHFTMEEETEGHLPFLGINIYRRWDGSMGHKIYRKSTHTDLYLNPGSHHHPSSIHAILSTLVHRGRALCDKKSLHDDLRSSRPHLGKMVIVPNRFDRPSTRQLELVSVTASLTSILFIFVLLS